MSTTNEPWEQRLASAMRSLDEVSGAEFVAQMQSLVTELPSGDAVGLCELGCAQDSTGHPEQAVPLYQAALETGLVGGCVVVGPSFSWQVRYATLAGQRSCSFYLWRRRLRPKTS